MSEIFKSTRARKIYGIVALSAAFLCTVLRTLSMLFFFDKDLGYYQAGAALPIIFEVLTVVSLTMAVAFALVKPISVCSNSATDASYVKYSAILSCVGFAAFTLIYVRGLVSYLSVYALTWQMALTLISSIGACVFFLLIAFTNPRASILYVLTGCLTVIWLALALASSYFDNFVQMNAPSKVMFIFGALGGMLLVVNEMRRGLNEQKNGLHLLGATAASILLASSSLPSIIGFLAGKMPVNHSNFYYDIAFFSLSIFAVARLVQMCFGTKAITPDEDKSENAADENQE